ncbi:sulfurtransferase-like selenium metabolism protein YedF [Campylobacter ureolyticus]|uniref:sulfurtransferase-like selenium metabolism protein YedF n=1 Tax=Campylobacter ureolyticus TaxID=827 RepID=UPI0022B3AAC7|nr:sulfurtransferase-like selenium metabolism protein YedF [Campylobacter ureolyticus]MCZ6103173.1 sulfurtransferase-like selenium metabolism protein YedF [Campylobacter ureolyticus]MCZ6173327.1 sulfurtransferase-like selenium metabolism protein YedF [Campylobacter ureolyticus]MCZ6186152.1 sulfurtransferase-like selenium metabolism protein YedF [Campylobacter ureolyticus]MDU4981615.1 sulfurtransferase-like selenium metabolism protein YedF [Campylobacter ureolyticus]MDU5325531.1 sulfurtransfera
MGKFYDGEVTYTLDLQGEACPLPAIALVDALPSLKKGEVLELICDCPQSINSIPYDAKNRGFEILSVEQDGPTIRFIIKHP